MHKGLTALDELPWTISYVFRKRLQIESFNELPREKRPPDRMIWYGTIEEVEKWFDKVTKQKQPLDKFDLYISEDDIE